MKIKEHMAMQIAEELGYEWRDLPEGTQARCNTDEPKTKWHFRGAAEAAARVGYNHFTRVTGDLRFVWAHSPVTFDDWNGPILAEEIDDPLKDFKIETPGVQHSDPWTDRTT